jgi:hypothetical protein
MQVFVDNVHGKAVKMVTRDLFYMEYDKFIHFLKEIEKSQTKRLLFSGLECFIHPQFQELEHPFFKSVNDTIISFEISIKDFLNKELRNQQGIQNFDSKNPQCNINILSISLYENVLFDLRDLLEIENYIVTKGLLFFLYVGVENKTIQLKFVTNSNNSYILFIKLKFRQ